MRNQEEIQKRLENLVAYLAQNDPGEDSSARVHARALDLVWVLHPEMGFNQQLNYLTELVSKWKVAP